MSRYTVKDNIVLEGARIIFRNFSGKAGRYNKEGDRSFAVVIDDPEAAEKLKDEGWNVREMKPREEGDPALHYLNVSVSYAYTPPMVILVTGHQRTKLDEDTIDTLDWAEITNVDLVIRPYNWEVNGNTGVKAYLKTMYVTIEEDVFANKYRLDEDEGEGEVF